MENIIKLIILLIINGFMQMNAQQSQQRVEKTFANTQFDLDPNLSVDKSATESPDLSQQHSPLALSVKVCLSIYLFLKNYHTLEKKIKKKNFDSKWIKFVFLFHRLFEKKISNLNVIFLAW